MTKTVCVAGLIGVGAIQGADDFLAAIDQVKKGVSPVVCIEKTREQTFTATSVAGTAFFITKEGTFVSAAHVIRSLSATDGKVRCNTPAVYLPTGDWNVRSSRVNFRWFEFTDCLIDEAVDVAVCRTKANLSLDPKINMSPLVIHTSLKPDGTPIAFTGFPLRFLQPITAQGSVGAYRTTTGETGPNELLIDRIAWPGASGSPVYTSTGTVIGMILKTGVDRAAGISYCLPSILMMESVTKQSISFSAAPTATVKKEH